MLFYQVGEWFQSYAVSKSRRSITSLMDSTSRGIDSPVRAEVSSVELPLIILPSSGTRSPGFTMMVSPIFTSSGSTCTSLPPCILTIQTTKEFGESTVAKILDLVENASDKKGKMENFITRFARYYTPVVVFAALALAILPPLVTGQAFSIWIYRALTFLVISCPCALVISIPLSFFGGIGGASKIGVLSGCPSD